ncbi:hypothetical protein HPB48_016260 [Haemaphysalis longicornis]|uniref:Uncharacterized protein n=1 Tax=Haemaphysalis longicornis TaxID=44386 RepID=A0A9J6G9L2_HAELO|nr:hypothetical protein HPB48_016260 [Haemaphysalis longicornis]
MPIQLQSRKPTRWLQPECYLFSSSLCQLGPAVQLNATPVSCTKLLLQFLLALNLEHTRAHKAAVVEKSTSSARLAVVKKILHVYNLHFLRYLRGSSIMPV